MTGMSSVTVTTVRVMISAAMRVFSLFLLLHSVQQVKLRHDAQQIPFVIDDGDAAEVVLGENVRDFRPGGIGRDHVHVVFHQTMHGQGLGIARVHHVFRRSHGADLPALARLS